MKTRRAVMKTQCSSGLVALAVVFILATAAIPAQAHSDSGCAPNGNRFNLVSLVNPAFIGSHPMQTQASESVAFILGRGGHGDDLVVGTALDVRQFGNQTLTFQD